jgi:hypothetical protein
MNSHNSGPNAPVLELEALESKLAERYPAVAHWNIPKIQASIHMRHDYNHLTVGGRTNAQTIVY